MSQYHLDDSPELTSCCLIVKRQDATLSPYSSKQLGKAQLENFYGADSPLWIHYVRDLTGGKLESRDFRTEPWRQEDTDDRSAK